MADLSPKYYTYFLIDPRSNDVFYVGKGCGKRLKRHARLARAGKIDNPFKYNQIKSIHDDGLEVIEHIHKYHTTEDEAFAEEKLQIHHHKSLTNITMGTISYSQAVSERAKILVGRLKSIEDWKSTLDEQTSNLTKRVFGSLDNAYNMVKTDLCALI